MFGIEFLGVVVAFRVSCDTEPIWNCSAHAFSPTIEICRKLIVNWGTYPHHMAFDPNPNRTISAAINILVAQGFAKTGDHLVIVSDMLAGEERFDTIQLRVV